MRITESIHSFPWTSEEANNCNTFFIDGPRRILVDPGLTRHFHRIEKELSDLEVPLNTIDYIVLTHIHPDHFEAAMAFREFDTQLLYHRREWELLKSMEAWLTEFTELSLQELKPHRFLSQGPFPDPEVGLNIIHTPGHSPGSISLFAPDGAVLICGDVLFKDGVGRTDLPGGNGEHLKMSIRRLADTHASALLPGHGPSILGPDEVRANFKRLQTYWFSFI